LTEAGAGSSSRSNVVTQISGGTSTTTTSGQSTSTTGAGRSTSSGATARTYKVLSRDTLASIARKSGVKLEALMAANPGVVPQKLRIGQSLNLPAP
jgi:LysM repeat protein